MVLEFKVSHDCDTHTDLCGGWGGGGGKWSLGGPLLRPVILSIEPRHPPPPTTTTTTTSTTGDEKYVCKHWRERSGFNDTGGMYCYGLLGQPHTTGPQPHTTGPQPHTTGSQPHTNNYKTGKALSPALSPNLSPRQQAPSSSYNRLSTLHTVHPTVVRIPTPQGR